MKDGKFSSFHSNGRKKEEGFYNENKKDGKWITWYGNGYKMSEEIYKDGFFWENFYFALGLAIIAGISISGMVYQMTNTMAYY